MQRVASVESARAFVLKSNPPQVGITAQGWVPTSGWSNPTLTPWVYIVPPADGIQDFDFVATPPTGIILPVVTPIAAHAVINRNPKDYWGAGKALAGVRIHARENDVVANLDQGPHDFQISNAAADAGPYPWPWPWLASGVHMSGGSDVPFPLSLHPAGYVGMSLRVYHTGDVITKDYRLDRCNIELSRQTEKIVRIWVG